MATNTTRKRLTYWLTEVVTPLLLDRAFQLNSKGYDVQFFTQLEALLSAFSERRAGIIVIGDGSSDLATERQLLAMMARSDILSAKMVMVRSRSSPELLQLASCAGVRDIIPLDLDDRLWLTRFVFATANRALPYVQPAGQVTFNNISALTLPARLTWLGQHRLRLECRVRPPVGAALTLGGTLAQRLGLQAISLTVVESHRSQLRYRFSDAIVANWTIPTRAYPVRDELLASLKSTDPGPRRRVFVAIQRPDLRTTLLDLLSDPRYEVSTALAKSSLVDEPRFFTPELVLIEDALAAGDHPDDSRFNQMLSQLAPGTSVLILGRLEQLATIKGEWPELRFGQLSVTVPMDQRQTSLINRLLARPGPAGERQAPPPGSTPDDHPVEILSSDALSRASVSFPARLHRLHPLAAQVALPFPVGNFALCRLESPVVKRLAGHHPYLKITATYPDLNPEAMPFGHLADGYLADLSQGEQRSLAAGLGQVLAEGFQKLDPSGTFTGAFGAASGDLRTPELGSLSSGSSGNPAATPLRPVAATRLVPVAEVLKTQAGATLTSKDVGFRIERESPPATEPAPKAQKRKAKARTKSRNAMSRRDMVTALVVLGFTIGGLWALIAGLSRNATPHGGVYSSQLEMISPRQNAPDP